MLDFRQHYYEVTEDNIDIFKYLLKIEDIRNYDGRHLPIDMYVKVGHVLGNNNVFDRNPKHTGLWLSKDEMNRFDMKKLTTELPKVLMTIE